MEAIVISFVSLFLVIIISKVDMVKFRNLTKSKGVVFAVDNYKSPKWIKETILFSWVVFVLGLLAHVIINL